MIFTIAWRLSVTFPCTTGFVWSISSTAKGGTKPEDWKHRRIDWRRLGLDWRRLGLDWRRMEMSATCTILVLIQSNSWTLNSLDCQSWDCMDWEFTRARFKSERLREVTPFNRSILKSTFFSITLCPSGCCLDLERTRRRWLLLGNGTV